jgi:hypothetical protein
MGRLIGLLEAGADEAPAIGRRALDGNGVELPTLDGDVGGRGVCVE